MARILILTAHSGGGHVSLAHALRERLSPADEVLIVDPLPRAVHLHYRLVSRYALWLWAAEFRRTNTRERALAMHRAIDALFGWRLRAILRRQRPDLVIATAGVLTYAARHAQRRVGSAAPFVTLFADGERLHATWLTVRDVDATLAPTHETYAEARAAGFPPERLHLVGWPVRAQFLRGGPDRTVALARLGLDPGRITAFVQGGAEGTAGIVRTVESVLAAGAAQVILAAGTNRRLRDRFAGAARVRAVPFTEEIAPLMAAADVVLGKAGPNMLFEAVTLGKPFVATTHIPGQEEGNLALIERYGLGWVALEPCDQRALIVQLAAGPAVLAARRASVERYRVWNTAATQSIGPLLRQLAAAREAVEAA